MSKDTKIAWTDHTWNPIWGCQRVSEGCQMCYAEALSKRFGKDLWGKDAPRQVASEATWRAPLQWNARADKAARHELVFCASMADVFEDHPTWNEIRPRVFETIRRTRNLTYQLLTKRPENVWLLAGDLVRLPNIWLGVTVENQRRAEERIPILASIRAYTRFLSVEPMLEPIDLRGLPPVDWVICGGESGPTRRPFDLDWARDLRDQCAEMDVPFFFKQAGGLRSGEPGPEDLEDCKEFPRCWAPRTSLRLEVS